MKAFDPIQYVSNDNLIAPEIGSWGIKKYKLMGAYCDIFTTAMKSKWDQLVYIDLFSGSGIAKIKNEGKYIRTSSLVAMTIPNRFSKYVLCELDEEKITALQKRVSQLPSEVQTVYIQGDSNKNIDEIIKAIPNNDQALRFCFVDPFSLNLEFETIRKVAALGRVDFLILLALQMDGQRNFHNYIKEHSTKIDKFLGSNTWREPFKNGVIPQKDFVKYMADVYDTNMRSLGYHVDPSLKFRVESNDGNLPIYYLAFYSKSDLGNNFYKKVEKYMSPQPKFDF